MNFVFTNRKIVALKFIVWFIIQLYSQTVYQNWLYLDGWSIFLVLFGHSYWISAVFWVKHKKKKKLTYEPWWHLTLVTSRFTRYSFFRTRNMKPRWFRWDYMNRFVWDNDNSSPVIPCFFTLQNRWTPFFLLIYFEIFWLLIISYIKNRDTKWNMWFIKWNWSDHRILINNMDIFLSFSEKK